MPMQPRPSAETRKPDLPRVRNCIDAPSIQNVFTTEITENTEKKDSELRVSVVNFLFPLRSNPQRLLLMISSQHDQIRLDTNRFFRQQAMQRVDVGDGLAAEGEDDIA